MLAGRVKLIRFLLYISALGVLAIGGLIYCCGRPSESEHDQGYLNGPQVPEPEPPPSAPTALTGEAPHLAVVLAYQGQDLGSPKVKDAHSAEPWKVNLYQDAGHSSVNRAKVDLDRDEWWDEKWTFDDGGVQRQVSPDDDATYTETWHHTPSGWQREGAEAANTAADSPEVAPAATPAASAEPWVAVVMSYRGQDLGSTKLEDVTKGKAFKVNVYQDAGNTSANRAKLDIDRDDAWDQKWTFDDSGASVKIAPADDEDYSEARRWTDAGWVDEP